MEWYAVRTRSNHEGVATLALRCRFPEVLHPTFRSFRWARSKRIESDRSLFPGYLFLYCDSTQEAWLEARKAHGVVDLVGCRGGQPEPIPPCQIESVRRVSQAGAARPHPYLRSGDTVEVVGGIFNGLTGEFRSHSESKGVLIISIDLLGQAVSVEVDSHSVRPC